MRAIITPKQKMNFVVEKLFFCGASADKGGEEGNMKIERNKYDKTVQRLIFEKERFIFDIEIRGYITIFEGESNTDKTFLMRALCQDFENYKADYHTAGIEEVILLNSFANTKHLGICKKAKNSLICIDNADTLLSQSPKLLDYINYDGSNQYLIVSRSAVLLNATPNHYCTLIRADNRIYNHFDFSVLGWK